MSSLSFSNIAYIARKRFTGDSLYDCFSEIRELLSVSPVTENEVDAAINLRANDFEDAVQYCSAKSVGAEIRPQDGQRSPRGVGRFRRRDRYAFVEKSPDKSQKVSVFIFTRESPDNLIPFAILQP